MSTAKPTLREQLGVTHAQAIVFKQAFDAWIAHVTTPAADDVCSSSDVELFDDNAGASTSGNNERQWPSTWPTTFEGAHSHEVFGTPECLVPHIPASRRYAAVQHRNMALDMLRGLPSAVVHTSPRRQRDAALARLLIAGVNGDIGAFVLVALLDMLGVRSSYAQTRVYTPLYMSLAYEQTCTDRDVHSLTFAAHAMVVATEFGRVNLCVPADVHTVTFTDFRSVMEALLGCNPRDPDVLRRSFPWNFSFFIDDHTYSTWPREWQMNFTNYCSTLKQPEGAGYCSLIDTIRNTELRYKTVRRSQLEEDDRDSAAGDGRRDRNRRVSSRVLELELFPERKTEERSGADWDAPSALSAYVESTGGYTAAQLRTRVVLHKRGGATRELDMDLECARS